MHINQIQKLSEIIQNKHEKFNKNAGCTPYVLSENNQLFLVTVSSQIRLIVELLIKFNVIDYFDEDSYNTYHVFKLYKNGLDFSVEILTDGKRIVAEQHGFATRVEMSDVYQLKFFPNKDSGYDWEEIVDELVEFIHAHVYLSHEVFDMNFDAFFKRDKEVK